MANFGMKITLFTFFRMKIKFVLAVFVWALMVFGQHSFAQEMIDGVYHISSVEDLKSFTERVNNGENTANAILTCDLDLDNKPHTPIGSNESPYMGHFDGGTHSISNIIIYNTIDGKASVALYARDGKIWLNQQQMAELFGTSKPNISMHIAGILKDKELDKESVVKKFLNNSFG